MAKGVTGLGAAIRSQKAYDSALQQERMTKEQLRKREGHLKHKNGGKIQQVGLHKLPEELLLGALILLSRKLEDPAVKEFALKLGKQAMAKQAAKKKAKGPPEVFIAFPDPPPDTLCKQLREMGLHFNPRNLEWRGPVDYDLMMRVVVSARWDSYVLRSGYARASCKDVSAGSDTEQAVAAQSPSNIVAGPDATKTPLRFVVELEN